MKKSKLFLLVLAVFLLLPLPCLSESSSEKPEEITLTMPEWQNLKNSIQSLKEISEQKDRYILTLENSLQESKSVTLKKKIEIGAISFSVGIGIGALAVCVVYLCN